MLVGNELLCGFHPNRVYTWFMELFVDAYDWVMVPNVYGMSQSLTRAVHHQALSLRIQLRPQDVGLPQGRMV